jgi:hypothetical protein
VMDKPYTLTRNLSDICWILLDRYWQQTHG